MPISRELSPIRYPTEEARQAELARRHSIQYALLNLPKEVEAARRESMSRAQKGRPKPKETVLAKSTTWNMVKPLVLRGALVSEIIEITDFTRDQVRSAIYNKKRTEGNRILEYTNREKEIDRRRRSHAGKRRGVPISPQNLEDQQKKNALAKAFLEAGLITEDLSYWKKLQKIYEDVGKKLPESFYEKLRLEVFLIAREALLQGSMDLLIRYKELGDSIDPFWFANSSEEERFMEGSISSKPEALVIPKSDCVHHWILGQPSGGIVLGHCKKCGEHKEHRDEQKDYRVDNNGRAQITISGYNGRGSILDVKDFA